jgi:hypothetical protein
VTALPAATDGGRLLTLVGGRRVVLPVSGLSGLPTAERDVTVACASGERYRARYCGVPVLDLLSCATLPDDTTHLLVEGDDGYRVTVPVGDALDALVALGRDGTPLVRRGAEAPRFVASAVDGSRMVSGVRLLAALTLPAAADPERLERLWPDEDPSLGGQPVPDQYLGVDAGV